MSDQQFERAVNDWLEDGSDRTPRRAIDGVLLAVKTTPQERDLRIPWRFPGMPAFTRATTVAAVALVASIGAGTVIYLSSDRSGGPGAPASPVPTVTLAPTVAATTPPTAAPSPQPTFDPTSASAWKEYTSAVYGFTMKYPSGWKVYEPAINEGDPELFSNDASVDGDEIGLWVHQVRAPAGADLNSWDGLKAALQELCDPAGARLECPTDDPLVPMCLGDQECRPAIITLVSVERTPAALFGDPETGLITVFVLGREDDFPAAARYGGGIQLLKAIVGQLDVREPKPGETPH
ncbi:MAG TPA: hypothetical protein VFP56_01810 [Candidatus Limnocylindrales bacterium]|nr:hypothetical protein [Candidatus Limnocylindrales bacterium]